MPSSFPTLEGHRYMNLTTFRKTGVPVTTPVWFVEDKGKLYLHSAADAGKVKRIRNNPRVELAPSTMRGKPLGPPVEARARILDPHEQDAARQLVARRYGWQFTLVLFFGGLLKHRGAYLEISPVS